MLKRTMMLLGLTITVGALLLVVGCGGSDSTMPITSSGQIVAQPTRGGSPPSAPILGFPWNNFQFLGSGDGKIFFTVRATDPEGDRLKYKIELLQNGQVVLTFDQTEDPTGWSKPDYASGEWAVLRVKVPQGTYQWRAYAYDGSQWGPPSNPERTFSTKIP